MSLFYIMQVSHTGSFPPGAIWFMQIIVDQGHPRVTYGHISFEMATPMPHASGRSPRGGDLHGRNNESSGALRVELSELTSSTPLGLTVWNCASIRIIFCCCVTSDSNYYSSPSFYIYIKVNPFRTAVPFWGQTT